MAAGDISFDPSAVKVSGDHFVVTGTIEVDDTAREFAIVPKHYILWASVQDADTVNYVRVARNSSDGTEGSQSGSLYVDGSDSGPNTFSFAVAYK